MNSEEIEDTDYEEIFEKIFEELGINVIIVGINVLIVKEKLIPVVHYASNVLKWLKNHDAITSFIKKKREILENMAKEIFKPLFSKYCFPDTVNKYSWVSQLEYYVDNEDRNLLETVNIIKLLDRFLKFTKLVCSTRNSVESALRHQMNGMRRRAGIVGVILDPYNFPDVEEKISTNSTLNYKSSTDSDNSESDSHNDQDGIICISDNAEASGLINNLSYCSVVRKQLTRKQCKEFGIEYPASRYAYYH